VARIYNLGSGNSNGESDNLYLGKKYGDAAKAMVTLPNNAVVVDADQEVLGKLVVAASIDARGDISTKGNLRSDGDASIGKNMTISGQTRSVGNLYTDGQFNAKGNAFVEGTIQSNNKIKGLKGLEISEDGYFGGNIQAKNIKSDGNVDSLSLSSKNLVISGSGSFDGAIYAPKIIDSNNNNYELDPDATSRLNAVLASSIATNLIDVNGRLNANEYLYIGGTATEGASCNKNGLVGKTSDGELVSCKNGIWGKKRNGNEWRVAEKKMMPGSGGFHRPYCVISKTKDDTDLYAVNLPTYKGKGSFFVPLTHNGIFTLYSYSYTSSNGGSGDHGPQYTDHSYSVVASVYNDYVSFNSGKCPDAYIR
jgi:cytoskeletal protein CcmA (bactofilin family)